MSNAPIARIEDHAGPSLQLLWQWKRRRARGKGDGRRIRLDLDPAVYDPDFAQPLRLVVSQHLKHIDAPAPEIGEPQQHAEQKTTLAALGDQALWVKIHDAV